MDEILGSENTLIPTVTHESGRGSNLVSERRSRLKLAHDTPALLEGSALILVFEIDGLPSGMCIQMA
jgi:hypothetical protein